MIASDSSGTTSSGVVPHLYSQGPDGIREDIASRLTIICAVLHGRLGRDFSQYKTGTLLRRIQRRMHVLQTVPTCVRLVMEGLAYRYKTLPGGQRQIMALLVPGDFCNAHISLLKEMDHSIGTLTTCRIVEIPNIVMEQVAAAHSGIQRGFWWSTLVDEAILREWLVGMGQRPADRRMGHLFCELHARLKTVGLATDSSFDLPLSQIDLGDVLVKPSVVGLPRQQWQSLK